MFQCTADIPCLLSWIAFLPWLQPFCQHSWRLVGPPDLQVDLPQKQEDQVVLLPPGPVSQGPIQLGKHRSVLERAHGTLHWCAVSLHANRSEG